MSKPFRKKWVAWSLAGWFVAFAGLFPQSVAFCFGEPDHVEPEIRGVVCCCMDAERMSGSTGASAHLPADPCGDCYHVEVSLWCCNSNRPVCKDFDRHTGVRGRFDWAFVPSLEGADEPSPWSWLTAADLIPPPLLEHLSTSILIC
jgi:hypothetical protein